MRGTAVVVGAGVAGLAVARGLLAGGWSVQVLERTSAPPRSGTALGMWPAAMAALDRLGMGVEVQARSVEQRGVSILRPDGGVRTRVRSGPSVRLIARPDLLGALATGLPDGTVAWGVPVTDLARLPRADVVVGADGVNSIVRARAFTRPPHPRPLGTVAFRGIVPGSAGAVTETWGPGRLFGITPQSHTSTNWFACVRAELLAGAPHDLPAADVVRRLYRDWHPAVGEVLSRLESEAVDRRTLLEMPPLRSYVSGRYVLLGDAAHAMAPNLGRGACESLVDAVVLAEALTTSRTAAEGLRRYDRLRRAPTRRIVRASRLLNQLSTSMRFSAARYPMVGEPAHRS